MFDIQNSFSLYTTMKLSLNSVLSFLILFLIVACGKEKDAQTPAPRYITVSSDNESYFSYTDGSPYIPVGINMINPSGSTSANPDTAFYEIGQWMKGLSENGGNYIRIWLSQTFWDIEDSAGQYNEEKAQRIDRFINMARRYGLRIKITLEHFRSLTLEENPQRWATKFVYHKSHGGPLDSIRQYLSSAAGQQLFLNKLDFYKQRYGSDTLFFGWELWNAMKGPEDSIFFAWNVNMLDQVKKRFPENMVMQSLGSFDTDDVRGLYKRMMLLDGNEIAQVHRYLDLGASMEICHQSMDIICASAVSEILSYQPGKPVILAETGAVEPRHAGPSKYYPLDTAGILLHDILFAPFFSGSAGAGMSWHWESYVHKNNLWFHFRRFNEAIKGINPIEERFVLTSQETADLRIYQLKGKKTNLFWLRDKTSSWQSELEEHVPPRTLQGVRINFKNFGIIQASGKIRIYDPWKDLWTTVEGDGSDLILPDFSRSIVVSLTL
jgi:hypothetical protein